MPFQQKRLERNKHALKNTMAINTLIITSIKILKKVLSWQDWKEVESLTEIVLLVSCNLKQMIVGQLQRKDHK